MVYYEREDSNEWQKQGIIIRQISKQVFIKQSTFHIRVHPCPLQLLKPTTRTTTNIPKNIQPKIQSETNIQEPPTTITISNPTPNQKQTHTNNLTATCKHHTALHIMKHQQTLNDSLNWRMKAQTETQPLIQSVLVKHQHPVLAFKIQSYFQNLQMQ